MGRALLSTAVVLTVLVGAPAAPATGGSVQASCDAMDLSPEFARDRTAMCVARYIERPDLGPTKVDVYLTTDAGRSWKRQEAAGLVFRPDSQWIQVVFSPLYRHDRTIFVQEQTDGVYATTDNGKNFARVGPLATGGAARQPTLTPFVAPKPWGLPETPVSSPGSVLAYASGFPAVVSPPLHVPVAGTPGGRIAQWLLPRSFPATQGFALVSEGNGLPGGTGFRSRIYSCDAHLSCTTPLMTFPDGHLPIFATLAEVKGRRHLITAARRSVASAPGEEFLVWRSSDDGRTWTRWPSIEALFRQIAALETVTAYATAGPDGRLFLRIDHTGTQARNVPAYQLFASRDDGRSWSRLAYGLSAFQKGPRGTLPRTNSYAKAFNQSRLWISPTGQIFTLGKDNGFGASAVYCSRDGHLWRVAC